VPLVFFVCWSVWHALSVLSAFDGRANKLAFAWLISFLLLWWIPLAWWERPIKATARQQGQIDQLSVSVQIPVYNEDEDALKNCLQSVFDQTRQVQRIRVVDDGSMDKATGTLITYDAVKAWALVQAASLGIDLTWDRQVNKGKRHAQMLVLADDPSDIFVTLDSDSVLDERAVEQGLKPFGDPKVKSVAGMVVVLNSRTNFLTRMLCMLYTPFTRGFRSAQSVMRSVMVNSGTLAFYRGEVIRKYAGVYENEEFFGRPMQMNDDSMMTMYALLEGDAVHQPDAVVYTLVPESWQHYINQQMRWMRGTFVRNFWWLRYMPLTSVRFWMPLVELIQFFLSIIIPIALLTDPDQLRDPVTLVWSVTLIGLAMNYLVALRFFMIRRTDESVWFHLGLFLLAPVAGLWRLAILRPMHMWAMFTCWKVGKWGTRDSIEVGMDKTSKDVVPA
jgi:hyaluronan synthase